MSKNALKPEACVSKRTASSLLDSTVITRKNSFVLTRFKVIGSGKILEFYEYESPVRFGPQSVFDSDEKYLSNEEILDILVNPEKILLHHQDRSEEYDKRRISRAKAKIRRLAQMNFDKVGKMLTLTFRDTQKFDIKSLAECLPRYQYFIKKLRELYPYVAYIGVAEFQDKYGRGAVHYHLLLNIPFTEIEVLRKLWRYGFIKIQQIDNPALVGVYVAKYFSKSVGDKRYKGHRFYSVSQSCVQPVIDRGDHLKQIMEDIQAKGIKPIYSNTYFSKWCGEIKYTQYNLYEKPAQIKDNSGST